MSEPEKPTSTKTDQSDSLSDSSCSPSWLEDVEAAASKFEEGMIILRKGPLSYYLQKMSGATRYLTDRFSPFRVGENVELAETPVITSKIASGWMSSKHFLVKGAKAIVTSVDCDEKGFSFGLEFPDESFVYDGEEKSVSQKHQFWFREKFLCRENSVNHTEDMP